MKSLAWVGALVSVPVLFVGPSIESVGYEGDATRIEAMEASVGTDVISVSGMATFMDVPVQVASDPTGDVTMSGMGTDLASATISRPDPTGSELVFAVEVADGDDPVLFGGPPGTIKYSWYFFRRGGGLGMFLLLASRTTDDPHFELWRLPGGLCCEYVTDLVGTMGDGVIRWKVPFGKIGAQPGRLIQPHADPSMIRAQLGVSTIEGFLLLNDLEPDTMPFTEDYRVPEATVELGIAPAGTPLTSCHS